MSVHSKDRKTGRTKLERISLRARKNPSGEFNNLGHAVDRYLLQERYQQQDGRKAVGVDGVTKSDYGKNLNRQIDILIQRIRRGVYKPKPSRVVEIPKEDGSKRPLAIACFEDKLVQSAVSAILTEIYEPMFYECSYGFRPGRNCHQALRALMNHTFRMRDGAVVEIDIQGYFNTIPHKELLYFLQLKIKDKRFIKLIATLMRTPRLNADNEIIDNESGCPQGSIVSPILANIYLHHVIDEWFNQTVRQHLRGRAEMVRYADDMVFIFSDKCDAERFYKVLPKRFMRFGLALHEKKSQLVESGRDAAARAQARGEKLPSYKFLGFVCYWGKARKGFYRLKYKSRGDRITAKLHGLKRYLRKCLTAGNRHVVVKQVIRIVKGWINYHAISDNERRVKSFVLKCKRYLFKWLNRRGGRRRMNWERFARLLKYNQYPERWKTTSMFTK